MISIEISTVLKIEHLAPPPPKEIVKKKSNEWIYGDEDFSTAAPPLPEEDSKSGWLVLLNWSRSI